MNNKQRIITSEVKGPDTSSVDIPYSILAITRYAD